ncbi:MULTISPECIES: PilZ domain-containing protein [Methylobacterium]|uniref:PilZ domain-containing protein n=1 Tax=Methylobacterium TaxID=407 RepID=UPI001EDDE3B7|nr:MULTISPECIES: PilZ domain-containing protein [Methylobacterium]
MTDDVSLDGIQFRSATTPFVSEVLTCSIRGVGLVEARVVRVGDNLFTVRLLAGRGQSSAIAASLIEFGRQQRPHAPIRTHPRVVPRCKGVSVTLESGDVMPGRLIDVSATGVALHIDDPAAIGTTIRIGQIAATVVRHIVGGMGASFHVPLDPAAVTESITF